MIIVKTRESTGNSILMCRCRNLLIIGAKKLSYVKANTVCPSCNTVYPEMRSFLDTCVYRLRWHRF